MKTSDFSPASRSDHKVWAEEFEASIAQLMEERASQPIRCLSDEEIESYRVEWDMPGLSADEIEIELATQAGEDAYEAMYER